MSGKEHQPCGAEHFSRSGLTVTSRRDLPYACSFIACLVASLGWAPPAAAEDPRLLPRMLHESKNGEVRARAAAAMGRRRDENKRPDLEVALADKHPSVRAAAANALGQIGSRASLPSLNEVTHDHVKTVVVEARQAIHSIETHGPLPRNAGAPAPLIGGSDEPAHSASGEVVVPRYGLMLGEMRNQSGYREAGLVRALGASVERNLQGFTAVAVFAAKQLEQMSAAQARGLGVFRMDGSVTAMSATTLDGQLWLHCEVLLLVMERSTGLLRSVLKGAARGVEVPSGQLAAQKRSMARRVMEAAVRSALRNADTALADALHRSGIVKAEPPRHSVIAKNRI